MEEYGLVPAIEFITIAEKSKLIIPVGEKIIMEALGFLNRLNEHGHATLNIAINISAIQLLKEGFRAHLLAMINARQVDPQNVCLEITESVFAANFQELNNILGELKATGIHISIDDFGTGYSSLAREQELNVDCLKIDKYFIDKLMQVKPEEAIASDIISLAHKMGHCAIA